MKKYGNKIIAILLTAVCLCGILPLAVYADDTIKLNQTYIINQIPYYGDYFYKDSDDLVQCYLTSSYVIEIEADGATLQFTNFEFNNVIGYGWVQQWVIAGICDFVFDGDTTEVFCVVTRNRSGDTLAIGIEGEQEEIQVDLEEFEIFVGDNEYNQNPIVQQFVADNFHLPEYKNEYLNAIVEFYEIGSITINESIKNALNSCWSIESPIFVIITIIMGGAVALAIVQLIKRSLGRG